MAENEVKNIIIRYPNLLEEIRIRKGECRQAIVSRVLKAANITEELFAAALADGEKLSDYELYCVAQVLNRPVDYIKSSKLKTFNKNRGDKEAFADFRNKVDRLIDTRRFAERQGAKVRYWANCHYQNSINVYKTISESKVTPYAFYLFAIDSIRHANDLIDWDISKAIKAKQPPPRGIKETVSTAT